MRFLIYILFTGFPLLYLQWAQAIPFFDRLPRFELRVEGDRQLQDWLREQLEAQRNSSSVLQSYRDPRDVARYERGTLGKLLRSRGYYNARVRDYVSSGGIDYLVAPGPQTLITSIELEMPQRYREGIGNLPLSPGDPLDAGKVLEGVKVIEKYLGAHACLLDIDVSYQATLIRGEARARLVYRVAPSPEVRLGEVRIEGLTSVNPDFLRGKLQLEPGDCFSRRKLNAAQLRLLRTNLISSANSRVSAPYEGTVDVVFVVVERRHRTVRLGVGYTSDEGAGVTAGWEHRNIFGRGEKVEVESKANPVQQSLQGQLLMPRFFRDRQSFSASAELSSEDRDAYQADAFTLGATVSRKLSKHRTVSVGGELKFSQVQEQGEATEDFSLLSLPLGFKLDTTDNLLDARRGATAALEVRPYADLGQSSTNFVKNTLALTGYITGNNLKFEPTLALRIKAGVISGIDTLDVPADERFYAGGGGSVRGYAYQSLGPRRLIPPASPGGEPTLSDPIGGRALSEISLEGRFRFTDTWSGVLFLDGGNAYEDPPPRFGSSLFWGTGVGVRYITSFAPLRLDIAFPLEKRDDLDDDFQVYVSLGQAF
ncbi:autotransporter assembly complex family protein [Microbulbifer sp. TYP-18]|uniref:autotransporter assembly complex family protein n=1 Tax=Microbulbifer sp. TYP-18 TaxID=3230024 RepID=UPI0034C6A070